MFRKRRLAKRSIRLVNIFGALTALLLLGACSQGGSTYQPADVSEPEVTHDLAVLHFHVPPEYVTEPTITEGWWFGAETVYRNANAGKMLADYVAAQVKKIPGVDLHSRDKIAVYLLGKRQLLVENFPNLRDAEYSEMLTKASPLDYGRELAVDHVLTGRVLRSETRRNNTIETWHSTVEVEVELWDVKSGKMLWSRIFERKDRFASQPDVMMDVAADVARRLEKAVYRLQNKALGRDRPSRPKIKNSVR